MGGGTISRQVGDIPHGDDGESGKTEADKAELRGASDPAWTESPPAE